MLVCVSSIIKTENWCHWQRQIRGGFKVYFDRSICVQDTLAANNFNRAYAEIQKSRIFSRAEMFSCQLLDMGISCYTSPRTEIIQSYSLFNQKWQMGLSSQWNFRVGKNLHLRPPPDFCFVAGRPPSRFMSMLTLLSQGIVNNNLPFFLIDNQYSVPVSLTLNLLICISQEPLDKRI